MHVISRTRKLRFIDDIASSPHTEIFWSHPCFRCKQKSHNEVAMNSDAETILKIFEKSEFCEYFSWDFEASRIIPCLLLGQNLQKWNVYSTRGWPFKSISKANGSPAVNWPLSRLKSRSELHMKSMKFVIPSRFISWVNSFSDISRKWILPNMIRAVPVLMIFGKIRFLLISENEFFMK